MDGNSQSVSLKAPKSQFDTLVREPGTGLKKRVSHLLDQERCGIPCTGNHL